MPEFDAMRFFSPEQVATVLSVTLDEVHALIGSGELLAIRVGRRGPWRVDSAHLEAYILDQYRNSQPHGCASAHSPAH